jgi:hypothetical protein
MITIKNYAMAKFTTYPGIYSKYKGTKVTAIMSSREFMFL